MRLIDKPCDAITGPEHDMCTNGGGKGGGGGTGDSIDPTDPLGSFAHSTAKAAAWVARKVGDLTNDPSGVDLTNGGFLRQYAIVFAASTILVLVLWLLAVAKRAVRGVPFMTAIGEAVSLLWLSVLTTAFAPLALYTVIAAVGAVTKVLSSAMGRGSTTVFDALAKALEQGQIGGGSVILIVVSLLTIALCGAVGLLLILRALGLYVGALLGIPVFAGLVDRDLWSHSRRWVAFMVGLIAVEPLLVIVIGLAGAVQASGDIVTGLGITAIALAATVMMIGKTPGWGDSVRTARATARGLGGAAGAFVGGGSAATGVIQGIHTHGGRNERGGSGGESRSSGGGSKDSSSGGVAGGIAAHGGRTNDRPAPPPSPPRKRPDSATE